MLFHVIFKTHSLHLLSALNISIYWKRYKEKDMLDREDLVVMLDMVTMLDNGHGGHTGHGGLDTGDNDHSGQVGHHLYGAH